MRLTVFFSPADVKTVAPSEQDIYIVIDVVRATTSLVSIFDQGASRVLIADTVAQARDAKARVPSLLLCGERKALPLPGFDFGNSPAQFANADLHNQELVLTTTNGTRAFFACPQQSIRLAGCFYNAQAVCAYALTQALAKKSNIAIVCAAERGYFALDDAACAGYLAHELHKIQPDLELHESVLAATSLAQTYPPSSLVNYCNSTRGVIAAGLQEDIKYCTSCNMSQSIPQVAGQDESTGLLILTRAETN